MQKKFSLLILINVYWLGIVFSQGSYYFSGTKKSIEKTSTAKTIDFAYPIMMEDVRTMGMGNTWIANGKNYNGMMANPALLGRPFSHFEILGFSASIPGETFEAATFLADHMNEFVEAASFNQVWDGLNVFFDSTSNLESRLNALTQIQKGLQFSIDLFTKVTGPSDNPQKHGLSILPSVSCKWGHWGFSLYGFGHSGFIVHMSPTLDAMLQVNIPSNLNNPIAVTRSMAQLLGIMATVISGPQTFSNEIFPIAYYVSYFDMVGTVGYAFQPKDRLNVGVNLKIINRRFSTNRIPVLDYDSILSDAWNKLKNDVTGITLDLGGYYNFPFGTDLGLSFQNIIPVQKISQTIQTDFSFPKIGYDRDPVTHQIITNTEGDTALTSTYIKGTVYRPYQLKSPLIANIGICHPISPKWDVALDWIDLFENDSRYEKKSDRFRVGTEYRWPIIQDKLIVSIRLGMADHRITTGMGIKLYQYCQIDGAYGYDRYIRDFSYFSQIKFGW